MKLFAQKYYWKRLNNVLKLCTIVIMWFNTFESITPFRMLLQKILFGLSYARLVSHACHNLFFTLCFFISFNWFYRLYITSKCNLYELIQSKTTTEFRKCRLLCKIYEINVFFFLFKSYMLSVKNMSGGEAEEAVELPHGLVMKD